MFCFVFQPKPLLVDTVSYRQWLGTLVHRDLRAGAVTQLVAFSESSVQVPAPHD